MPPFKDFFSEHSSEYAAYRPDYPQELFDFLTSLVDEHDCAWDCATGNGQAAIKLAETFKQVIATDASEQQLQHAVAKDNIIYQCAPAEKTNIPPNSVNLITVAQALHWFNFSLFFREAERVLKNNGVVAAWIYDLIDINPAVNKVIVDNLYNTITRKYWDNARHYYDDHYTSIPFPLNKISTPQFTIEKTWDLSQVIHYVSTWSGLRTYQQQTGINPLDTIADDLQKAWGDPQSKQLVRWPIYLLAGKFY